MSTKILPEKGCQPEEANIWKKHHDENFDPNRYLRDRFVDISEDDRHFHRIMKEFVDGKYHGKLLEIGSGPSIMAAIAASGTHSEIHLSDYCRQNVDAIQAWLDGSEGAHQWDAFFKAAADYEMVEVSDVEKRTINHVKSVFELDVNQSTDELVNNVNAKFDTIVSLYCFENACTDMQQLRLAIKNAFSLLNPGGRIVTVINAGVTEYNVGDTKFKSLLLTPEQLELVFTDVGFSEFRLQRIPPTPALIAIVQASGVQACFITAQKK